MEAFDFAVVGAGIAGVAVAAQIAGRGRTLILDSEPQAGRHATGRSAALFTKLYGNAAVRALTAASEPFFRNPPPGFSEHPLLAPRACVWIAPATESDALPALARLHAAVAGGRLLSADEVEARVPILRAGQAAAGLIDEEAADIDVHGLHGGYVRQARAQGAVFALDCRLERAVARGPGWELQTSRETFAARTLINAAGAWADEVAAAAGVAPRGLQPLRRTIVCVDLTERLDLAACPFTVTVSEDFYMKTEAGRLLISPADETPSAPCDAQPEEIDIAVAIDRLETLTHAAVRRVVASWAGLRTFSHDRSPIVGFDPGAGGFFWLAGQGGFGVQTAPALSRWAAALLTGEEPPAAVAGL
ncbi:MAG TPA: FAD-binding oxidoreductase [Steroidobacteraceae bacterium]|nr:FAD-binding oxidoreductase [Steroidobacteraceae bacterium]